MECQLPQRATFGVPWDPLACAAAVAMRVSLPRPAGPQVMTTVLVCGDRYFIDYDAILAWMRTLPAGTRIVHGKQRGADLLAARAARELGLPIANATVGDPDGGYPYITRLGKA